MRLDLAEIKRAMRAKIVELANAVDIDAGEITDTDIIPATRYLDSTAILELVVWFENPRHPAEAGGDQQRQSGIDRRDGGIPAPQEGRE